MFTPLKEFQGAPHEEISQGNLSRNVHTSQGIVKEGLPDVHTSQGAAVADVRVKQQMTDKEGLQRCRGCLLRC